MINVLFYKYIAIENPEILIEKQKSLCSSLGLKGKILVSDEGVNGNIMGEKSVCEKYMTKLREDHRFSDVQFKITKSDGKDFRRLIVKYRGEIIRLRAGDVDLKKKAPYIEPAELKKKLDDGEEIVFIDARNNYEYKVGRFKGAINPKINIFSEWPKAVEKFEKLKDKTIVTYCTGGVRCEKASAYLKEKGFNNVYQLHGGILNYGNSVGSEYWEGKCFVFDKRKPIDISEKTNSDI